MSERAKVLLVDDNPTFLRHVRRFLETEAGVEVVDAISDPTLAVSRAAELTVDICVIDLSMPGLNGLELLPLLRSACPRARVVVLTSHADDAYRDAAIDLGASAFVTKSRMIDDLPSAIKKARSGG